MWRAKQERLRNVPGWAPFSSPPSSHIFRKSARAFGEKSRRSRASRHSHATVAGSKAVDQLRWADAHPCCALDGGAGRQAEEPRDSRLLSVPISGGQGNGVGVDGLHAQVACDPQWNAEEWDVLVQHGSSARLILKAVAALLLSGGPTTGIAHHSWWLCRRVAPCGGSGSLGNTCGTA